MHNKRWVVAPPITSQADEALAKFPPILKQIVFNRGLATDAEATLKALGLDEHLSPQRANGVRSMVQRIKRNAETALAQTA